MSEIEKRRVEVFGHSHTLSRALEESKIIGMEDIGFVPVQTLSSLEERPETARPSALILHKSIHSSTSEKATIFRMRKWAKEFGIPVLVVNSLVSEDNPYDSIHRQLLTLLDPDHSSK